MNFKKWVKSIQAAAYNGARTVVVILDGSYRSFYHVSTMNRLKDAKLLHIKDLFQFLTIVSVCTEFGGQMGVGGSGNWWGQTSWLLRMQLEKLTIFNLQLSEFFYLNFFLWMFNNWTCFSCEIRLKTPRIAAFLTVENSSSDRIKDLVFRPRQKLLLIKDLFQFSTIVSISTKFGGQMGSKLLLNLKVQCLKFRKEFRSSD